MNSLVVHGLGLHASNAGGSGLIPGQETKIPHATSQPSPRATTREELCAARKSQNRKNKK